MAQLTQRANVVRYYDAFRRQWVIVPESDLTEIKKLGNTIPLIQTWITTALPDIASTRSLLAIEALSKDGSAASSYKLLLDARLALYDLFRMSLGNSFQTATMAAFLQVADAGIQSFVNERERLQYRINVSQTLGSKAKQELIGNDDALTGLRSFANVFAAASV